MNAQTIIDWVNIPLSDDGDMLADVATIEEVKKLAPEATDYVPMLMGLLRDTKPKIRRNAAFVLGWMRGAGEGAIPALGSLVMDPSQPSWVRVEAAWALWAIGPASLPQLVEALNTSDVEGRKEAARHIRSFGPKAAMAVPALIAAFNDDDKGVRYNAIDALEQIGEAAVPHLVRALSGQKSIVRVSAATVLLKNGPSHAAATQTAVECLNDPDDVVRYDAACALMARAGAYGQLTLDDYRRLLTDRERYVRQFAALALRNLDMEALPALNDLIAALDDQEVMVRCYATEALGNLGPHAHLVVSKLIDCLANDYNTTETVVALGNVGPEAVEALPALEDLLKSLAEMDELERQGEEVASLESAGRQAILQIRGERSRTVATPLFKAELADLVRAVKERHPMMSIRAMFELVNRGADGLDSLVELLGDSDVFVRATALSGIRELGPRAASAISALRNGLTDQEIYSSTPMNALYALALTKLGEAGVAALREASGSVDPVVKDVATRALRDL